MNVLSLSCPGVVKGQVQAQAQATAHGDDNSDDDDDSENLEDEVTIDDEFLIPRDALPLTTS